MSRLTVAEKEHWKSRIERRINKAIEALEAQDASLMSTIEAKADQEAHVSLGTADLNTKIQALKIQQKAIEQEVEDLELAMHKQALGSDRSAKQNVYSARSSFFNIHHTRCKHFEKKLLAESSIGREILKLQNEKEALLDTVWLATSSIQIRELWNRVALTLGDEPTPLQKEIMTTEPVVS